MSAPVEVIAERVRRRFVEDGVEASVMNVSAAIRAEPGAALLGEQTLNEITERLAAEFSGAGLLTSILAESDVSDVLVNGRDVWVDRGNGLCRVPIDLGEVSDVRRFAQRLAALGGRRLDEASPCVDVQLPDGTRLHAVLPPIARGGPFLSLRTFRSHGFSLEELVDCGTVTHEAAEILTCIVVARLPYVITGGTGCGKTTVLAALLSLVPPDERIVLVEDSAELQLRHPHVVALQARTPNVEGFGTVTLRNLVREALRMRPDRLVIGECRGAEIVDLLGALNTGHEGGAATLHANACTDVPARLESLGLLGGISRSALHAQISAALRIVIHLRRAGTVRIVDEICLFRMNADHFITSVPVWQRDSGRGPAAEEFVRLLQSRGVRVPSALSASSNIVTTTSVIPALTGPPMSNAESSSIRMCGSEAPLSHNPWSSSLWPDRDGRDSPL